VTLETVLTPLLLLNVLFVHLLLLLHQAALPDKTTEKYTPKTPRDLFFPQEDV
jgi:hypothetical protein